MQSNLITCPKCREQFALTAAIEQPIIERLGAQFAADSAKKETAIKARELEIARQAEELKTKHLELDQLVEGKISQERKKIIAEQETKAKEAVLVELRDLKQQVTEKDEKLAAAQEAQLELLRQKRKLDADKVSFELEKVKQIEAERQQIRDEARRVATEAASKELRDLKELMALKEVNLDKAQKAELEVRKQKAELEEQQKAFDLELVRKADEVKQAVAKDKDEEFRLKEAEANKKIEGMKRQIDELKRKAEQGSEQTQGEVLELDLEGALRRGFRDDGIIPVPKGTHGGDLLHEVRDEFGHRCGTIIWESKWRKTWSDGWLDKLKDDKIAAKAQIAVLVSTTMPKDVASFECRENVWIAPPALAIALAAALRSTLIDTAAARRAAEGRQDKMEVVYDYLAGPEFKSRVTAIFESFTQMRDDLESEKSAMRRIWAKREKQIERVLTNTVGMHGDLEGIIGQSLPRIESMELPAPTDDSTDDAWALPA